MRNATSARIGKPLPVFLALILLWPAAGPASDSLQDLTASEYGVKAVFLFNFTRYLEWPEENGLEYCPIAVLGKSEILGPLREIAAKKTAGSRPIQIRECRDIAEIGRPRILFLSASAADQLPEVLAAVRGTDILVVGETEGFGSRGVPVNFVLREGTVRFEINVKALKNAGIQASSQLLKLAILVDTDIEAKRL